MLRIILVMYLSLLKKIKSEKGATLIELIVSFIVIGIAMPSVILTIGQMGINHGKTESVYHSVNYANEKMEEIMAFKHINNAWALWANTITDFAGTETLADGSIRTVTVTNINNWINNGAVVKNAYQIDVSVTPLIGPSYSATAIFAVNF